MIKKCLITALVTSIAIGTSGCTETLTMTEVPTTTIQSENTDDTGLVVGTDEDNTTTNNNTITEPTTSKKEEETTSKKEETTKPKEEATSKQEETITKKEEPKENKIGDISTRVFLYKADAKTELPNSCIVNTKAEWDKISPILAKYTCSNIIFNGEETLETHFYLVVAMKDIKSSWVTIIDSVKNDGILTAAILTEKRENANATMENRVVLIAVSREDIPNIKDLEDIQIKQSSYTIKTNTKDETTKGDK